MADKPDRLIFLGDYAKTVITLSSALLALLVTFQEKLVGATAPDWVRVILEILWVALLVATLAALWMVAYLTSVLRLERRISDQEQVVNSTSDTTQKAAEQTRLNALRTDRDSTDRRLNGGTNVSYLALVFAVGSLCVLGFAPRFDQPTSLPEIVDHGIADIAKLRGVQRDKIVLSELKRADTGDSYTVSLLAPDGKTTWLAELDAQNGAVRSLK
jgi:hypothetical protein